MASNVTRDHHNLRRNLKLNDNYISNDGGDEGIAIDDDGVVTIGTEQLTIDRNITTTSDGTYRGASIDLDKTGASTGTNSMVGLHIDMDNTTATDGINTMTGLALTSTLTHAEDNGVSILYGAHFVVTGGANSTSVALGLSLDVRGADDCRGLYIDAKNQGKAFDIRIVNASDINDYFQITTVDDGATTIQTVDAGAEGADLTLNIDGYIDMNSASGEDITLDSGGDITLDAATGITRFYLAGDTDDLCTLTVAANGATTIATADSDGSAGHLVLDAAGIITLDSNSGRTIFADAGDTTEYASITVAGGTGATSLTTLSEAADGHLTLNADGNIIIGCNPGGSITLQENDTSAYTPSAASDAVPLSHLPFVLYSQFQDDLGSVKHYLPLKGYFEQSFVGHEPTGMIAPFNMKLQKVIMRCAEDISGGDWTIGMWMLDSGTDHDHHHTTGFNWV